jgi:hypothetical protein
VLTGCRVGRNCYVATGAIVLQGASIGDDARIGAGSIVHATAALPDHARVGMRHVAVRMADGFLSTPDVEAAREAVAELNFFETAFWGGRSRPSDAARTGHDDAPRRGPWLARRAIRSRRAGMTLLAGFSETEVPVNGTTIKAAVGGDGPPVLLLHGYPQTHAMWHRVAPNLAEHFAVVCPDLRGYGDSAKPESAASHEPYSKRVMAQDQIELMNRLGSTASRWWATTAVHGSPGGWRSITPAPSAGSPSWTSFRPRRSTTASTRSEPRPSGATSS